MGSENESTTTTATAAATVEAAAEVAAGEGVVSTAGEVPAYPVAPGYRLNVRSGPGTKYPIVRVLTLGAWVQIYCQTPGEWVSGPYGTSNIWDNIAPGQFVADAYVKTGSDGYVARRCG
ncbi:SH3 domain-containing protein [Streptomyces roseicoloratus]|uniref:SH3 domain-containing protein n=1 Tax=Streptomyces roseicoloratus TaxID=2508722 RepID=A0ABY9RWC6_9ACTN|nr:SH3 domain-containing protein [Streptomyces roseicoloratus]WMX46473.1 SH3 domain-containing protein [Streptomyces roseicoloratus]